MNGEQLNLCQVRSINCPFLSVIDDSDNHCYSLERNQKGYDVITCDHSELYKWLKVIRGVGFKDIRALPQENISIPKYVPIVCHGSGYLMKDLNVPFVAITLGDLISEGELHLPTNIKKRYGVNKETKIILLNYAHDALIEKLWPRRDIIFSQLADMGFYLMTGVNYSVWHDQPHAERLINLKRSLITYQELQNLGIPAIPHLYWYGTTDLMRWIDWLTDNPSVQTVAINLQTINPKLWRKTMEELSFFVRKLTRKITFLITGPSSVTRIVDIKNVLPEFTLTSSEAAMQASFGFLAGDDGEKVYDGGKPRAEIFYRNLLTTQKLIEESYSTDTQNYSNIPIQ